MKNKFKFTNPFGGPFNIVMVVALFCGSLYMLTRVADTVRERTELSYAEYLDLVEAGCVEKVEIMGAIVNGMLKSEFPLSQEKEEEISLQEPYIIKIKEDRSIPVTTLKTITSPETKRADDTLIARDKEESHNDSASKLIEENVKSGQPEFVQTFVKDNSHFTISVTPPEVRPKKAVKSNFIRNLSKYVPGSKFETIIAENNPDHWNLLRKHGVEFVIVNPNTIGFWPVMLVFLLLILLFAAWYFFKPSQSSNSGGGPGNIFTMGKSRAKMFLPSTIKDNFNSVAGATEAKEELQDVVDFLKNPEKYRRLGAKITRGALLVGEPGNGKTLLARAVAGEANCPFFSISGSDFIEVFVGVGASRVRDLFAQARKYAPSIVFIDEIDAVGRQRSSGGFGGGHDEREQTLNQLLTEMDGFEISKDPIIVLAATNRPDILDKALLRPGRFDRQVEVPFPDLVSREQILKLHAQNVIMDPSIDMRKIARGTPGFSGADLANLINEAAIIASKKNQNMVTLHDFEEARDKVILGKEIKTIILTEEDRKITAFHESGHALIRLLLPKIMDPLHKITIIPRGRALGVTHSMPEREKFNKTQDEMFAFIQSALGGRIAEELEFGMLSTGAMDDFSKATDIARDMVCRYGMSDLGPVIYSQRHGEFNYSEKTAEKIDEEVLKIINSAYKAAKALLVEHRDKLEKLSYALLEKETMYASEIYELLDIEPREDHKFTE